MSSALPILVLPLIVGAQLGPSRVAVDEAPFLGCVDVEAPFGLWGSNETCAQWAGRHDAVGHCNVEVLELPPDCDDLCQQWFHDGNPLAEQCPDTCGYCGAEIYGNLLEPAANAAAELGHPGAIGHFIIQGDYFCLQGPIRHQTFMLSLLKSGSFGALHSDNTMQLGPCSVADFPNVQINYDGDTRDHCYPPGQLFYRTNWTEIEDIGWLPVGDLLGAMAAEGGVVDDWDARSSWSAVDGDPFNSVGMSLGCFCVEGSEVQHLMVEAGEMGENIEGFCEEWSHEGRHASFVTEDGLSCVQAHFRYANRALATLRSSSLARLYTATRLEGLTCEERGFTEAAEDHPCFPQAARYFASADGPSALAAHEEEVLAAYSAEHHAILGDHSPEAVRSCSCLPGSLQREDVSAEECNAPELHSPVLHYWPIESM